jgi:threonine synthase
VAVSDEDLLDTQRECARADGALPCPEAAAALHAARRLAADGWIGRDERVVVLNTGSPLVQPELLPRGP